MTSKFKTPAYISNLLQPTAKKQNGRKVWSVDLETVWLPFFTASNTMGDTAIPHDALGCPLRLNYAKDGSVKFNANGRPVIKVAKPISEAVQSVKANFIAQLQDYTEAVASERQADYATQVDLAREAGKPVANYDNQQLNLAIQEQMAEAMRQAELTKAEAEVEVETEAEANKVPVNA